MMRAMIQTVLSDAIFMFIGSNATAAIAAVRAHKMIDAMGAASSAPPDTPATRLQIPYSSVLMVQFMYSPDDTEVEDDNCKTRTPAEQPKGLMVHNEGDTIANFTITLSDTSINGTYGGVTFTDGVASVSLEGDQAVRTTGIPDGTTYTISGEGITAVEGSLTGTTPANVYIMQGSV